MDILTLTLNPCVDRTRWVSDFGTLPFKTTVQSGGKGVNVARVLTNLGASALAIAPVGGAAGREFSELARAEGVELVTIPIAGETRVVETCVRAADYAQKVEVGVAPEMSEAECDALIACAKKYIPEARVLCVCGSACCERAAEAGRALLSYAKALGVKTLLDANGAALKLGAEALPDLIKPNQKELAELTRMTVPDGEEDKSAQRLLERGIRLVLVSLGERGAALFDMDTAIYCPAPRVETVNPVGSGDSFVAGYLYAQLRGANQYASLSYACAAGAANAQVFEAARLHAPEIEALLGYKL